MEENSKNVVSFLTGQSGHHTVVSVTESVFLGEADVMMPGLH